jgi:hypothetical protein
MTAPAKLSSEQQTLADEGADWLRGRIEAIEAAVDALDPTDALSNTYFGLAVRLTPRAEGPLTVFEHLNDYRKVETAPGPLRALLDAYEANRAELAALRQVTTPRIQWGIWWPDTNTIESVRDEETARGWAAEYRALVGNLVNDYPAVKRRTVVGPAVDDDVTVISGWEDAPEATDV